MTVYQVDLDVVLDEGETLDEAGHAVVAKAGQTGNVTFHVVLEHGPAGGNPLYAFEGPKDAVTAVARSHVDDDAEFEALRAEGMLTIWPVAV